MSLQPLLCGRRHDAVVVATSGWRLPAAASLLRTVICTDVDGTLFDSSHSLPAENARVLKLAMAAGCRVVLATGKAPGAWLQPVMRGLGFPEGGLTLNAPSVMLNGLLVTGTDGSEASRQLMPRSLVERALGPGSTWVADCGLTTIAYCTCGQRAAVLDEWTEHHKRYQEPTVVAIGAEAMAGLGVADSEVFKITWWGEPTALTDAQPQIEAALHGATVVRSLDSCLEVLPTGCGKAEGVSAALTLIGADASEVLALGDGENDCEMLRMVREAGGVSVAMANGMPRAKEAAGLVGLSNDEGGVAQAIRQFVIGEKGAL